MKKIVIIKKSHACNKNSFDSNINEVIRPVLNLLLFFYEKISHTKKAQKSQEAQKAQKAQKRNQAKVQNATSKQKQKMRLKNIKQEKSNLFAYLCFSVFFVRTKNRK